MDSLVHSENIVLVLLSLLIVCVGSLVALYLCKVVRLLFRAYRRHHLFISTTTVNDCRAGAFRMRDRFTGKSVDA